MINFNFENFDSTNEIMLALSSLDNLAYELRVNGYDYGIKKENVFELDGFFVTIYTNKKGDVTEVKVSLLKNEEATEVN